MNERILVPLDGSALAEAVLPQVEALAAQRQAEVVLLQAVVPLQELLRPAPGAPPPDGAWQVSPDIAQLQLDVETQAAERYLDAVSYRLQEAGVPAEARVVEGEPARTIVSCARDARASLIAMAAHAPDGRDAPVPGGVADLVTRLASVPVLLVYEHDRLPAGSRSMSA